MENKTLHSEGMMNTKIKRFGVIFLIIRYEKKTLIIHKSSLIAETQQFL